MTLDTISRDEALAVWGQRFANSGLSDAEIIERFDWLNAGGFLDFSRDEDGGLKVLLTERRSRQ